MKFPVGDSGRFDIDQVIKANAAIFRIDRLRKIKIGPRLLTRADFVV
jgi:hypothetical protein